MSDMQSLHEKNDYKESLMSFAGIGRGLWGETPEAVEQTLHHLKYAWEREQLSIGFLIKEQDGFK